MTMHVDFYYTMRSPYCYLATPVLTGLVEEYDLFFNLKVVYPLALSDKTFFKKINPMWPSYLDKDIRRIAARLKIPFRRPRPDPIVQDLTTREVAESQPYIERLTYFAQIASERGRGLDYVCAVSGLLHDPEVDGWDSGNHLRDAMSIAGFELDEFEELAKRNADELEATVQSNREEQLASGHWGAPLFVHEGEIFFGQDRIEDLVWHLKQNGLR